MKRESLSEETIRRKKEKIILSASELFLKNGIDAVRMTDIADISGAGVASLYRYFGTRTQIVIEAGTRIWQDIQKQFDSAFSPGTYENKSGLEQVSAQFGFFLNIIHDHPDFVQFLDAFDRLMLTEKVSFGALAAYERSVINTEEFFLSACRKGISDGSIRAGLDYRLLYLSAAHAITALAEKCARGPILSGDDVSLSETEPSVIKNMLLYYLQSADTTHGSGGFRDGTAKTPE